MRKLFLSLVLAAAAVAGTGLSPDAEARGSERIFIGIGDVVFSYGRPYYRHNREPLYVVYERGYPRYYRVPAPVYYAPPVYGYDYAPAYGYTDYRGRGRGYGYDYDRHDDRDYRGRGYRDDDHYRGDRGRGRGHDRDRRGRGWD